MRARSPCPADRTREMTGAGILAVALVTIAAALVVYLLIALIDPERF
nr:K+-transporting ATPase, F subunit [Rhodococcus sp. JVH1]